METANANPFCWATVESLSTVSATIDSYGAGEAVASKVGAGERGEPSGVGSLRAGPSGVGRMRAGTLEVTGGKITCSNVTCCSVLLQFLLCPEMQ